MPSKPFRDLDEPAEQEGNRRQEVNERTRQMIGKKTQPPICMLRLTGKPTSDVFYALEGPKNVPCSPCGDLMGPATAATFHNSHEGERPDVVQWIVAKPQLLLFDGAALQDC